MNDNYVQYIYIHVHIHIDTYGDRGTSKVARGNIYRTEEDRVEFQLDGKMEKPKETDSFLPLWTKYDTHLHSMSISAETGVATMVRGLDTAYNLAQRQGIEPFLVEDWPC